jgi:UDP-GlcNAc:undecaprenyl-phosphate GlcNAc-1-phosphate transferase
MVGPRIKRLIWRPEFRDRVTGQSRSTVSSRLSRRRAYALGELRKRGCRHLGRWALPYAAHFLNAFLGSVVLVIGLQRLPLPYRLLDQPTERKTHVGLVPLIGGLAMFIAFVLALALLDRPLQRQEGLLAALSLLVAVGVVDDLRDLWPLTKLVMHCAAAALMVVPDWRILDVVVELGAAEPLRLGFVGFPVSLLFVVGLINAINMIDGVDGLAGGVVAAILFWFALIADAIGRHTELVIILLLFFATLGFLVFNLRTPWRRSASVFMGDAGSMMLGGSVAYFTIVLVTSSGAEAHASESASLPALCWVLALPAIDTLSLIVRRLLAGNSPFVGDRRHLHHLLLDAGLSPAQVTALLVAVTTVLGGIGFAGVVLRVPDTVMALGLLLPVAAHTAFIGRRPARKAKAPPVGAASDVALFR